VLPRPIGLCGRPGAGKNATADVLAEVYKYRQASFAEALRIEVANVLLAPEFRVPFEILNDPRLDELSYLLWKCKGMDPWVKPTPPELRRTLQQYGTEYRRAQDPDYWVKQIQVDPITVVTDVRFPNEIQRRREAGGRLWYVHRTYLPEEVIPHKSEEIDVDSADRVLWNDGTLGELREQVIDAMRSLQ